MSGLLLSCDQPPADSLLLSNVTVIDTAQRSVVQQRCVLIDGDRIASVTGCERPPLAARVIDASGKFLLPGYWDMHVHALWDDSVYADFFEDFVAWGVTGVRDMASRPETLASARRHAAAGAGPLPQLVASGPVIDGPSPIMPTHSIAVGDAAAARAAIDTLDAMDADFVKPYTLLPRGAALALLEAAHQKKLPVAGHLPAALNADDAMAAGMASIEHMAVGVGGLCDLNDVRACEDTFRRLAAANVYLTPTLLVRQRRTLLDRTDHATVARTASMPVLIANDWRGRRQQRLAALSTEDWQSLRQQFRNEQRYTRIAASVGALLLAGTDAGELFIPPGNSLHDELALLVATGLTEMDALRAATSNPAAFLGIADQGRVTAGALANLVLLNANPLEDIQESRNLHAVILRGKWLDEVRLNCLQKTSDC